MEREELTLEVFLTGAEMLFAFVRTRETDRWSVMVCELKFASFRGSFPEVDCAQFLWACEQWIQSSAGKEFLRFPAWGELMAPLYACEGGLANRSFGFRVDLPSFLQPTLLQLAMLPTQRQSLQPHQGEAYQVLPPSGRPLVALPAAGPKGLTEEAWQAYLRGEEEADG